MFLSAVSIKDRTSAFFETSVWWNHASPPASRIWATALSPSAAFMSPIVILAPCLAQIRAVAHAIPDAPPVITIFLFSIHWLLLPGMADASCGFIRGIGFPVWRQFIRKSNYERA